MIDDKFRYFDEDGYPVSIYMLPIGCRYLNRLKRSNMLTIWAMAIANTVKQLYIQEYLKDYDDVSAWYIETI